MEHPKIGVVIRGLVESPSQFPGDVERLMEFGNKRRVTVATAMNVTSSRSHAVFMVKLHKMAAKQQQAQGGIPSSPREGASVVDDRQMTTARINLVDLAGSERQSKANTGGAALREGCAINQSLSALGMVIKALSDATQKGGAGVRGAGKGTAVVPFRASNLTFLLKDSLAGNSKTYMIAAVSPASENLEESLSTLHFASSVKAIKTGQGEPGQAGQACVLPAGGADAAEGAARGAQPAARAHEGLALGASERGLREAERAGEGAGQSAAELGAPL